MSLARGISSARQAFPGKPTFTEDDVPDMTGKVTIVTGSNTGIGKEVAQILYAKNAKVYMLARSESKTVVAIESIKAAVPKSTGELLFLSLDLADLTTIKATADAFLQRESQLHVLINNAGVGFPERGSKTKQGLELQVGVNCVGPFALTKLLTPTLVATAKTAPAGDVRVVWVSSSASEALSPKGYIEGLARLESMTPMQQYGTSKLGNYFHGREYAARHRADGIVSVSLNPGNLDSDFWRTQSAFVTALLRGVFLFPTLYGAYTVLFAACSPELTLETSGSFLAPWGRIWKPSGEMVTAGKPESEGGDGMARRFWEWTEEQVKSFV